MCQLFSRRRKTSPEPEGGMMIDRTSGGRMQMGGRDDEDMDTMDETMAAMVLTNLSCSPQSPNFPNTLLDKGMSALAFILFNSFPIQAYY